MSSANPLLSVIIPTLNEAAAIGPLLAYLDEILPHGAAEVIVSDGGSHDATVALARRAGVRVVVGPAGRARQLNAGAAAARGAYLYFLHADTRPPRRLYAHFQSWQKTGKIAACFQLRFDRASLLLRQSAQLTRYNLNAFRYGDQSLLVSRHHFGAVGGYDESYVLMEGNDLVRRLRRRGEFTVLPDRVITSARKYERYGATYLQFVYVAIYLLARLGVPQANLMSIYQGLLRPVEPRGKELKSPRPASSESLRSWN